MALSRLLREAEPHLTGAAISAGICLVRPRSVPDRTRFEAGRFLALIGDALRARGDAALEPRVTEEARVGAFACADADEAQGVVDVWRGVLRSVAEGHGALLPADRLALALDRIERLLPQAMARVAQRRADIVVIGGSAGGLNALTAVLGGLDATEPASFIIVLHTHETSPMTMPLVLSRVTGLAISYPVDGGTLCLGHAYIAAPGRHLAIIDGRMRLLATPRVAYSRPSIDVLFESAAASCGSRVLSVILSGSGRDGSGGTRAVAGAGGVTLAQDPGRAEFSSMPSAAIATGAVQAVGSLPALRRLLPSIIRDGRSAVVAASAEVVA